MKKRFPPRDEEGFPQCEYCGYYDFGPCGLHADRLRKCGCPKCTKYLAVVEAIDALNAAEKEGRS